MEKTHQSLTELCSKVWPLLQHLHNAEGVAVTGSKLGVLFLNWWPGHCQTHRFRRMKLSNAVHLIPCFQPWVGNKRPIAAVPTRSGSLCGIDLFDEKLPNWECVGVWVQWFRKVVCPVAANAYASIIL